MKITAIETLRTEEFSNVLWVRLHTDEGSIGLGETFYGAAAVEAHIHNTLAVRLLGKDPTRIEALNRAMVDLPMAQSSTGVEYRAASAIDIALWDLFGKITGQPVHNLLGGLNCDRLRIYNTCAGYGYVRSNNIRPVDTWNIGRAEGPYEDLNAFMTDAGALAENLLESGITAMKIWPFDPPAQENRGMFISAEQMRTALEPFEKIRKRVGDKMDIMVEFHCLWNLPAAKQIARAGALSAVLVRRPDPHEQPASVGGIRRLDRCLGLRQRDAWVALSLQGHAGSGRAACRDGRSVLDRWADRGSQDRRAGRHLSPSLRAT